MKWCCLLLCPLSERTISIKWTSLSHFIVETDAHFIEDQSWGILKVQFQILDSIVLKRVLRFYFSALPFSPKQWITVAQIKVVCLWGFKQLCNLKQMWVKPGEAWVLQPQPHPNYIWNDWTTATLANHHWTLRTGGFWPWSSRGWTLKTFTEQRVLDSEWQFYLWISQFSPTKWATGLDRSILENVPICNIMFEKGV